MTPLVQACPAAAAACGTGVNAAIIFLIIGFTTISISTAILAVHCGVTRVWGAASTYFIFDSAARAAIQCRHGNGHQQRARVMLTINIGIGFLTKLYCITVTTMSDGSMRIRAMDPADRYPVLNVAARAMSRCRPHKRIPALTSPSGRA